MSLLKSKLVVNIPSVNRIDKPKNTITERVNNNQFPKPHYSSRDIDKLNAVDLTHLLVWWDESSLVYEADHLKLANNKDCIVYSEGVYNTNNKRVYNVIETLKELYGFTFPKACYIAKTFMSSVPFYAIRDYCETKYPKAKKTKMSADYNYNALADENLLKQSDREPFKRVYSVLHNRFGIERNIISGLIHRDLLTLDKQNNICFMCRENNNVVSVIKYLSSEAYRKKEVLSVRRNAGFRYANQMEADYNLFRNVYVFENVIDLLSYLTLVKMEFISPIEKASCLIVLNGLSDGVLYNFLLEHQEVQNIYACLQNDGAGIRATKAIEQRVVIDMQPFLRDYSVRFGYVQSWNDILLAEKAKK